MIKDSRDFVNRTGADTNTVLKAGEIQVRETKRGIEFHAWNHERQRMIHIGTLLGQVYEKGNCTILRQPEPSICLPQSEYGAVMETGAVYLRCIPPDKSGTFSISLQDFKRHAEAYYNAGYGPQWRCALQYFQSIAKTGRRNPIIDNPVKIKQAEPEIRQISLF
jgi:hypothetical protein